MIELVAGAGSGILAGALSGVFGIGGGIVLVPALALLLGLDQRSAQGVTLAVLLLPVGLPAVVAYHRVAPVRWRLVAILVAGFVVGVGAGAELANVIPPRPLRATFTAFLVVMAVRTWRGRRQATSSQEVPYHPWHGLWIGALAGVLSGLLGIGGGVVMIGLLVSMVGISQHEAQATSLATMLPPIGLPGVIVYARHGPGLPWALLAAVAAGFLAGGWIGARVAVRVDARRLGHGFAVFLLGVAATMLWKVLR